MPKAQSRTCCSGLFFVAIFLVTACYPATVNLFAGDSFPTHAPNTVPTPELAGDNEETGSPNARRPIDFENIDYPLLHAEILRHTNIRRQAHGLPPLQHNQALEGAARNHAVDMRDGGFMSHTSPVPGRRTVPDRTAETGFEGSGVGENIAIGFGIQYTAGRGVFNPEQNGGYFSYEYQGEPIPSHTYSSAAQAVVEQWMNSTGHRENILRERYRYMGAGAAYYADGNFYDMPKFYYAQVFGM